MGDSPALLRAFRSAQAAQPDLAAWHTGIAAAWCAALPLSRSLEGVLFAALVLVSVLRLRATAGVLGRAILDPVGLCILAWAILTTAITWAESGWAGHEIVLPGRQFLLPLLLLPIVHRWRLMIATFTAGAAITALNAGIGAAMVLLAGGTERAAEQPSASRSLAILAIVGLAMAGSRRRARWWGAGGLLVLVSMGVATFSNRRGIVAVVVSSLAIAALLWGRLRSRTRAAAGAALLAILAAAVALPAISIVRGAASEPVAAGAPAPISPQGRVRTPTPLFRWQSLPGATWYQLWVVDSTGASQRHWLEADRVTDGGGECAATAPEALPTGEATWRVRGWSEAHGSGPWSPGWRVSVRAAWSSAEGRELAIEWIDRASSGRVSFWGRTLDAIGTRPWLGHGRGVWHLVVAESQAGASGPEMTEPRNRDSHNLALDLLFESGAIGLLLWLGVGVLGVLAACRRLPSEPALVLCLAMLAGWLASSMFDYPWARGLSAGIFFLFASITLFTRPSQRAFGEAGLGVEDDWVDGWLPPPRR